MLGSNLTIWFARCHHGCQLTFFSFSLLVQCYPICYAVLVTYLCFLTPSLGNFMGTTISADANATTIQQINVSRRAAS